MAELRSLLTAFGLQRPQTLLQSGNAVFQAEAAKAPELESELSRAAFDTFGFHVEFFLRSLRELREVVEGNPFPGAARDDPSHLVVLFTKGAVHPAEILAVESKNLGPEALGGGGREVYIHYPEGIGTSKLVYPWQGTARNWNTVRKLLEMASSIESG